MLRIQQHHLIRRSSKVVKSLLLQQQQQGALSACFHASSTTLKEDDKTNEAASAPPEEEVPPPPSVAPDRPIIPGLSRMYGSLHDPSLQQRTASIFPSPLQQETAEPWQAAHNLDVQRVTLKAMIYELIHQQTATIEDTVPWFLNNMPHSYFRQVPEQFRMHHIKAIAAIKDANMDLYLNLKAHLDDGRTVLTFVREGTAPGTLLRMVESLPVDKYNLEHPLTRLHVFSTKDDSMSLNMFVYGNRPCPHKDVLKVQDRGANILEYARLIQAGQEPCDFLDSNSPLLKPESLIEYMERCSETYINLGAENPKRFLQQRVLFDKVSGTEGTAVQIVPAESTSQEYSGEVTNDDGHWWVDLAVANSLPQVALENLCRILLHHKFDVSRARLDVVPDVNNNGTVTILRTLMSPVDGRSVDPEILDLVARELKRAKWLDPYTMDLVFRYSWLGITAAEIITGFCALMHPYLAKENAMVYSKGNILETISKERFISHAVNVAEVFMARFNPKETLSEEGMEQRFQEILRVIDSEVEDSVAQEILFKMMDICRHTLKTNLYMPNRYALGLRLDPKFMQHPKDSLTREVPFGAIFVHGRRFNGYHVRFRDIARGGLRLVTPPTPEQYALESARQYEECYGLAFAQQLKNKDIPEGGSKAVNLIDTQGLNAAGKAFVMRKSVKAFTDTILDLIVDTPETRANIVDFWGRKEVLYLGPDEQVIPEDIEWIVKRADYRKYDTPQAFMSSKPRAGINHKEFGVTSEGLNCYVDVALKTVLKLDPTQQEFSVKMTGGPDGDVAGNEIKILVREYGDNVKIVGVADHSGCAEDPNGLNHEELLRLVRTGLSISNFDPTKLSGSPGAVVHNCDTAEGVKARNSMHNRLEADAFLPCGGRPNTIDITNYKHFLKEDGTPSSPLIVEGANLFVTAEARQALFEDAGVVIVKDSSANKGGVITSSYEICAAMLCSEDEFFSHKKQIVGEVIEKLRDFAKLEATLLFREFETYGGSLPEVSQVISNSINVATDALSAQLDSLSEEDRRSLLPLFRAHLPKTLADLSFHEVHERVPEQYIKNAISSCLASKIVYKEGTRFISSLSPDKLAVVALQYLEKEKEVAKLMESLENSHGDMPEEQKLAIIHLLDAGGARTALTHREL